MLNHKIIKRKCSNLKSLYNNTFQVHHVILRFCNKLKNFDVYDTLSNSSSYEVNYQVLMSCIVNKVIIEIHLEN